MNAVSNTEITAQKLSIIHERVYSFDIYALLAVFVWLCHLCPAYILYKVQQGAQVYFLSCFEICQSGILPVCT